MTAPEHRLVTLPDGIPDRTLGWEVVRAAVKYLRQPNGPNAGQRWQWIESQIRFLLWWYAVDERGQWLFNHGARRLAKGPIAHTTPVPTPDGMRKHGDLRAGDRVYAVDGSITTVVGVGDDVDEDCYAVEFRDGERITCTGSHRWPVHEFTGHATRTGRVVTTADMYRRGLHAGDTARWRAMPSPCVDGEPITWPLPPYVLGLWLGDGDRDAPRITVGADDLAHVQSELDALNVEHDARPSHSAHRVRFGRGWAKRALRDAGVLDAKHVPERLFSASRADRWSLLQGLVDSDGYVATNGIVEVSLMAGRLADDVERLAVSLGLMPTRTDGPAVLNGRRVGTRARIRFTSVSDGEPVARLPRKRARLRRDRQHDRPHSRARTVTAITPVPSEPARCITVDHWSHVYLVGERAVPTCNSGKSPFAALLALAELCFPVRLKDFDERVPGGCVGTPVAMPLVQICATAESQTANTMRMVRAFAPKGSRIVSEFGLDPGKVKYHKKPEGTLEVITSSETAAEGAEATTVVADETEHWTPRRGGPALASTLTDNLAKSGSRMLETANAWEPGAESVAEDTYRAWLLQEEGKTRGETRILYDARIAAPATDLADEQSLIDALEFVYDDCWWVDRRVIRERIWSPKSRPDDAKRKYLNWPTAAADAWVTGQQWAAMADPSDVVGDGDEIVLFFDGSKSRDATALVGCRMSDGFVFSLGVWEPADQRGADPIPVADVDAAVRQAAERFTVLGFYADVEHWSTHVGETWPDVFRDGLLVWAVPSGRLPQPIAWDMRNYKKEFAQAAEHTEAEIRGAEFRHDGDAAIARHVTNARARVRNGLRTIGKESAPLKIDAAVCVIGARMVRRHVLASKAWRKRSEQSEGVVFF